MIGQFDTWFQSRLEEAGKFHMGTGRVHETVRALAADLDRAGTDDALIGGFALKAYGYAREIVDVHVLVRAEGLEEFKRQFVGRGYLEKFKGARKSFRNTQTGVPVEFLTTGEYPGDGKPKPVVFPDPAQASVEIEGIKVITLPCLVELKLASGMTQPARIRDLADVQDLIRRLELDERFAEQRSPYVRKTYLTLLQQTREPDPHHETPRE